MTFLHKYIRFTAEVEKTEIDFEKGMVAQVIGVTDNKDSCLRFIVDFAPWEQYNKKLGVANYFDKDHKPTLFWWETNGYPANKRETFYDEYEPTSFEIITEEEAELLKDPKPPYDEVAKALLDAANIVAVEVYDCFWTEHKELLETLEEMYSDWYAERNRGREGFPPREEGEEKCT